MKPACLCQSRHVSVCDLNGAERFIAWAIRWRASCHDCEAFAAACLEDSFDRAGLRHVQPAFEEFAAIACAVRNDGTAAQRLGCWRLNPREASVLHAIACLQSGLLGEAWKALAAICTPQRAGRALESLDTVAQALAGIGARFERWQIEDACRTGVPA